MNNKEVKGNLEHRKEAQGRGEDAPVSSQRTYRTGITRNPATSQERVPRTGSEAGAEGASKGLKSMGNSEKEATELAAPLAGWRGWTQTLDAQLASFSIPTIWQLVGENEATCPGIITASTPSSHSGSPALKCGCGFWGYRSWEHMQEYGPLGLSIRGVVALGGKVIQHEFGFRAQFAEIVALLDTSDSRRLRSAWEEVHPESAGFPVPLLSMVECEMLAIEQGCIWEPDVPEAVSPEIEQYLVRRPALPFRDMSWTSSPGSVKWQVKGSPDQTWDLVFAPVEHPPVVGQEYSRVICLSREALSRDGEIKVWEPDSADPMQIATLRVRCRQSVQYEHVKMWTFVDDDCRLDRALDHAIRLYGRDWLYRFSEEGVGS